MANQLLISVSEWDARAALVENGRLAEFYLERRRQSDPTANVYKGRVMKVLPGMNAAFIDIGLERPAYLSVEELSEKWDAFFGFWLEDETHAATAAAPLRSPPAPIEDLLRQGQELMVQICRPPSGGKGARLTTYITLPGYYLVYSPLMAQLGVSRRINNQAERERLAALLQRLKPEEGGLIARTASVSQTEPTLRRERDALVSHWQAILRKGDAVSPPALLQQDLDFPRRTVRELFGPKVDAVIVDDHHAFEQILGYLAEINPWLKTRVELYSEPESIFTHHGLDMDWPRLLGSRVWLKSGGYLLIDATEALTAIDVNTGRFIGRRHLEETIFETNLEAAREIARQVRLRNIGGLIVIDFIDMRKAAHREAVHQTLLEELKRDRAKTAALPVSPLGVVEMTRERLHDSLAQMVSEPCGCCDGKGYRLSPLAVAHDLLRQLTAEAREFPGCQFTLLAHPEVVALVNSEGQGLWERLAQEHRVKVQIREQAQLPFDQYEILREW